ncbi:MAG: L-Ala--D-Glu endopeptidase [Candidatus Dichloromethanomonas elyunquensis]|nr:MAG: L-Ala--D-Glu endopeptidase [Candidatus Dichloromethanomonas elyunquensis]
MKAYLYRSKILLEFIVILIVSGLVSVMIWKLFLLKNKSNIEDYQLLAAIEPDQIILYQKNKSNSWKDYMAIIAACKNITAADREDLQQKLFSQLDKQISFKNLNWADTDKDIRKTAQNFRELLNHYSIFDHGKYGFPLKQTSYYTDTYGADREGGARVHQGTDLFNKKGTPIYNVCPGTIEKMGWNRLGGERVGVRGDDGNYYYYAHLDSINSQLVIGKRINIGDLIGKMGNTGDAISTPDHLHFGIELPNGEWLNPYPFLKVWEYHSTIQFNN